MQHHEFTIDMCYATIDLHLSKLPAKFQRDREDLRQDIMLAVMERAVTFDPSLASWATFQDRLIEAYLENHLLGQRWNKNRLPESLEEIDESEPQRIPKTNDVHSWEINLHEQAVFFGEVQDAIDTLPLRLRDCAECLKHYSPAETAKILGISPSAVHRDMQRIQKIFVKANIHPNHFEEF
ncbi:MAG: sigma-70 family RNA polymerase sigma factor [Planctomycetaceae bacterium]|nr:sigma-70 family RNA polymerase sigma factor [Planctomycetaceae bacterium]